MADTLTVTLRGEQIPVPKYPTLGRIARVLDVSNKLPDDAPMGDRVRQLGRFLAAACDKPEEWAEGLGYEESVAADKALAEFWRDGFFKRPDQPGQAPAGSGEPSSA